MTERPAVLHCGRRSAPGHPQGGPTACKRFGSARYSVPVQQVRLRLDHGRLLVTVVGTGSAPPSTPWSRPVRRRSEEHFGGPRPAPRRAVRPKTTTEKEFCGLGPVAGAFLAALGRAVAFSRWHAADVRSILAAGPGTADPRRHALVLDLPAVPVRPLAGYALRALS